MSTSTTDKNRIHKDLARMRALSAGATVRDKCDESTKQKLELMRRGQ